MSHTKLRSGFTTGSAAAAAAKAAMLAWQGLPVPEGIDIPLPSGARLTIPLEQARNLGDSARASVIKDAGDDPDATHRARISAAVTPLGITDGDRIRLQGGRGVGTVTKPGLPVPPGEPAINPAPRRQIRQAVEEALRSDEGFESFEVLLEVEDGERIARRTMNQRLGIVGGISILGTRGTVEPYSSASYTGTIEAELDVARAAGVREVCLATGGRSERLLKEAYPRLPPEAFVLTADYFRFSLQEAVKRGFKRIHLGCFFGKLVKMAQGHAYTHAKSSRLDLALLADWARSCGLAAGLPPRIASANTAREVLEMSRHDVQFEAFIRFIAHMALQTADRFAQSKAAVSCSLFDFSGELIHQTGPQPEEGL
jgi:cobalt-precorrin-5B (C1)-methyltransferase